MKLVRRKHFRLLAIIAIYLMMPNSNDLAAQLNNVNEVQQEWRTDLNQTDIPLTEFTVLLVRDGIPPIDRPRFWGKPEAQENYFKHEPVLSFEVDGVAKAYPLSVLMWHEIVNDQINDTYFSITYCPLCNAGIAYDRKIEIEGRKYLLDFGVSGMLRNSDMVMWDRQTETWWQQFTGEGLVGELQKVQLEALPVQLISLQEFFKSYPDGRVLSTQTGIDRNYGSNPYVKYDDASNIQPRLFEGSPDERLPATERVVDVCLGEACTIYPYSVIGSAGLIEDQVGGTEIVIFYTDKTVSPLDNSSIAESKAVGSTAVYEAELEGQLLHFAKKGARFTDKETGSTWEITGLCTAGKLKGKRLSPVVYGNHFAFAWLAFYPSSKIYTPADQSAPSDSK